ncbi:hypothetical protein [Engelhardtia mirabilis]|uniref:Uncharacterized protein n=1 Tax=Engelhardtia mirabilis TaxID=2528011 RepID=A0A518BQ15_9BACT|nr:hypothetical protein Pla133_41810 [Planctomycetes bacterium Pla133]QDV03392.1 hypothetical protein Pla86_41800 [Planctomycetes bacterium Pla86]
MSSKSRNQPPRKEQQVLPRAKADDGSEHHEPSEQDFLEAEELLKTPKGRSPLTYAFLIFLLIFLLVVFLAADAFYAMRSGGGGTNVVMRWEHPIDGPQKVKLVDFERMSRTLAVTAGQRDMEPEQVASFMVADSLAEAAGIAVSDAELREQLVTMIQGLGGMTQYRRQIDSIGIPGGIKAFEETVRKMLRQQRYRALLSSMDSMPDVEELERTWMDRHQLRTFDYTYTSIEDERQRAFGEDPDDATLQAWFDERPDFERNQYRSPQRQKVELIGAVLTDPTRNFDALLAAYPDAEDADLEARAQEYYNRSYFARFKRPVPLDPPEDGSTEDFANRIYFPFEDVREECLREAAIKNALMGWRADIDARVAIGEEIDLAAEAELLGLDYLAPEQPLTQTEQRELDGLGGVYIAGALAQMKTPGAFTPEVTIGATALTVARMLELVEPTVPPLAEIRGKVLEAWADARAVELASETLDAVRDTMTGLIGEDQVATADFETFSDAVKTAGLPLERVSDLDRSADFTDIEDEDPAQRFLRTRSEFATFEAGQVSEPLKGFDGERVYLVRLDSVRDPDLSAMTAKQFQQLLEQQKQMARFYKQINDPLSIENLRERNKLWLITDDDKKKDESVEP